MSETCKRGIAQDGRVGPSSNNLITETSILIITHVCKYQCCSNYSISYKGKGMLPNSICEASITLNKNLSLMNIYTKILNKILAN
jgi:hypothetical protein